MRLDLFILFYQCQFPTIFFFNYLVFQLYFQVIDGGSSSGHGHGYGGGYGAPAPAPQIIKVKVID